jgi:hypothetical protein
MVSGSISTGNNARLHIQLQEVTTLKETTSTKNKLNAVVPVSTASSFTVRPCMSRGFMKWRSPK